MLQVEKRIGDMVITVAGESALEVFRLLAQAEDVFGHERCGVCGSEKIRFRVRRVRLEHPSREFDAYEIRCSNPECRAVLPLGIYADGSGLFVRSYVEVNGQRDYSTQGWRKPARLEESDDQDSEPPDELVPEQAGQAKLLVGMITGLEHTVGQEPYKWEIEFLPDGKKPGEELVLPYFEDLPAFVKKGVRVKVAVVRGRSGLYAKRFFVAPPVK